MEETIEMEMAALESVRMQLELYPESTLKDVYKSFFQDEFGPGHLLKNPERARSTFQQELRSMKSQGRRSLEPCGAGRRFFRVPLDLVLDDVIQAEDYFSAFQTSASVFAQPSIEEWKEKWDSLLEIIERESGSINDWENNSVEIRETLEKGNYVMHHSNRYLKFYDPHYRILSICFQEHFTELLGQSKETWIF